MTEERKVINELGDAATDVFEQMLKGNWIDDHGHHVHLNLSMHKLKAAVEHAIKVRETWKTT